MEEKVQKLRKEDPFMFSHPELTDEEVCIGFVGPEFIQQHLAEWRSQGLSSARRSTGTSPQVFETNVGMMVIRVPAILANAEEYCRIVEAGDRRASS